MERNKIIVFFGPSGAGKGEASRYALKQYPTELMFSVSDNTREPRPKEIDGEDYHFLKGKTAAARAKKFLKKVAGGKYLEWQKVYDNDDGYRGTPVSEISRIWSRGKTPVLDIDVEGAINVYRMFPRETVRILLKPDSWEVWEQRLRARHVRDGGDLEDPKFLARIAKARPEVERAEAAGFEQKIVNRYDDWFYNDVDNIVHNILGVAAPF